MDQFYVKIIFCTFLTSFVKVVTILIKNNPIIFYVTIFCYKTVLKKIICQKTLFAPYCLMDELSYLGLVVSLFCINKRRQSVNISDFWGYFGDIEACMKILIWSTKWCGQVFYKFCLIFWQLVQCSQNSRRGLGRGRILFWPCVYESQVVFTCFFLTRLKTFRDRNVFSPPD